MYMLLGPGHRPGPGRDPGWAGLRSGPGLGPGPPFGVGPLRFQGNPQEKQHPEKTTLWALEQVFFANIFDKWTPKSWPGPGAQMGPGPKRALGPMGPMVPGPKWARPGPVANFCRTTV